jgi:tellurite resistance protein TehA-like permease
VVGGSAAVGLAYLVPANAMVRHFEAGRLRLGGGMWLLWPVALDATSVAASSISRTGRLAPDALAVLAAATWTLGLALYLPLLAALLGRLVLADVRLRELGPSYWVTMGAAALSCLAAADIAANPATTAFVNPALATTAAEAGLGLWFLATALLPLVCALSVGRTLRRSQLVGSPKELWLPVFPTGMYALATRTLGLTTHVGWLARLGGFVVWLGVAVFLIEVFRGVMLLLVPIEGEGSG